ncbi:hypothetical protein ACTID9_26125 [Brevibacillus fluminis]|uniref:hypothetical protein n=1 Tax=Brevibacillus fluminis TaxID=511487 RepID=UPI003F8C71F3
MQLVASYGHYWGYACAFLLAAVLIAASLAFFYRTAEKRPGARSDELRGSVQENRAGRNSA